MNLLKQIKKIIGKTVTKVKSFSTIIKTKLVSSKSRQIHQLQQEKERLKREKEQLKQEKEQLKQEKEQLKQRERQGREKARKTERKLVDVKKDTVPSYDYYKKKTINKFINDVDQSPTSFSETIIRKVKDIQNKRLSNKRLLQKGGKTINHKLTQDYVIQLIKTKKFDDNPFLNHLLISHIQSKKKLTKTNIKFIENFYTDLKKYRLANGKERVPIEKVNKKINNDITVNDKAFRLIFRLYKINYDGATDPQGFEKHDTGSLTYVYQTIKDAPNLIEIRYEDTIIKLAHLDQQGYKVLHRLFLNFDYLTTKERIESALKTINEIYFHMNKGYRTASIPVNLFDYQYALDVLTLLKQQKVTKDELKKSPVNKLHRLSYQKVDIPTKNDKI